MKKKLLIIALISLLNCSKSYCQNTWQTIKKFNITTNSLEISSNNIMVVGANTYYVSSNETDWTMYNSNNTILSGTIVDSEINDDIFYISTNQKVYSQSNVLNEFYVHPTNNISQIEFYKNILMLSESNEGRIYLYKNYKLDTLDYNSIKPMWTRKFIVADDSLAITGYDNNFISKKLNSQTLKWEDFAPTIYNWYYCYLNKGIILGIVQKAGYGFYFSKDYGKTFISGSNPVGDMYQKTTFEYNDNTIYIAGKGLYSSINSGSTWNLEIKDSIFSDIKIKNGVLYALTRKGTLLKKTISPLTSLNNSNQIKSTTIYPNPFTNQANLTLPSSDKYTLEINDITGKQIENYKNIQGESFIINSDKFINGLYVYTLINQQNGEKTNGKFVIKK